MGLYLSITKIMDYVKNTGTLFLYNHRGRKRIRRGNTEESSVLPLLALLNFLRG